MALIVTGTMSGGGLTAFAAGKLYRRKQTNEIRGDQNETRRNGIENKRKPNESSRNRVGS
jgi:hypothetical protein